MDDFLITEQAIDVLVLGRRLDHVQAGAQVVFSGTVRDHHGGRAVRHLNYEGYTPLARRTGSSILAESRTRWPLLAAIGCHRLGQLEIGALAVWIGVATAHRAEAFAACAWIMDEVKARVPVWKRETYADGEVVWSQGTVITQSCDAPTLGPGAGTSSIQ